MDPVYDLSTIRRLLRDGIAKGYWTEEHFDTPSLGRRMLEEDMKQHKVLELRSFQLPPHRNLLRDYHSETVDKGPDPRDFQAPADTRSAVPGGDASVHLEGSDDSDLDHLSPEF